MDSRFSIEQFMVELLFPKAHQKIVVDFRKLKKILHSHARFFFYLCSGINDID